MSSPEISPPSKGSRNSEEICSRCEELGLKVLLGPAPALDHVRKSKRTHRLRPPTKEDMKIYEIEREHQVLRGTNILQRLAFEKENMLQQQCWICEEIQKWRENLPVKTFSWRRLDNSLISAPREDFELGMRDRTFGLDSRFRSPLGFRMGNIVYDFGVGSHLESSQHLLPKVHITGETPDYSKIKRWLRHCLAQHPRCEKPKTDALTQIPGFRLFHINRRCLVPYAEGDAFVALSYVWGSGYSSPEAGSSSLDTTDPGLQTYPLTIEHAILMVKNMGYHFMWIDSICIDQKNNEEKIQQIGQMHVIYSSATATLIPLHSPHAGYGIPGVVQDDPQSALKHERLTQIEARLGINGKMLVHSYHPPLQNDLRDSMWQRRGWTYQEGLLSQRRILVTRHQVHFVCNEMHCSEDNPSSWPTNLSVLEGLANLLTPETITSRKRHLQVYCTTVCQFTNRSLTNQDDSLNAVSAILTALQVGELKDGFIYGIPRQGFRSALLWRRDVELAPLTNGFQVASPSQIQFPSWSWCGWRHTVNVRVEITERWNEKCYLNPPLWISWNGQPIIAYADQTVSTKEFGYEDVPSTAYEDPVWRLVEDLLKEEATEPTLFETQFHDTALRVKGVLLTLPFFVAERENRGFHVLRVDQVTDVYITADIDFQSPDTRNQRVYYDCLVLTMWIFGSRVNFKSILLLWNTKGHDSANRVATRAGYVDYETNRDRFEKLWDDLNPRMEEFWLL